MAVFPRAVWQAGRVGGLLLLLGAPAAGSRLSWEGPAECQQAEQLAFQLERALGMPLERAGSLEFQVRVERAGEPASARLSVTSPQAAAESTERVLVAASCGKLVDTLAVAISLIVGDAEKREFRRCP